MMRGYLVCVFREPRFECPSVKSGWHVEKFPRAAPDTVPLSSRTWPGLGQTAKLVDLVLLETAQDRRSTITMTVS